jgi:hypothetical protein
MNTVTIDFIAQGEREGTWVMVLVEEGPWAKAEIEVNLRRLQERLYSSVDAALDGQLSDLYPETHGGQIIIRLDGCDLPQVEVTELFKTFSGAVFQIPDYADALRESQYVGGIAFELNLENLKH